MLASKQYPQLAAEPYLMHSVCKNPCLQQLDRLMPFKASLSESDVSALFNIVRQAWSKNSRYEDALKVPYLVEMVQRLKISPDPNAVTPWNQLLSQVEGSEFARLVYYESLAFICSLNQMSDEHQLFLQDLQQAFKLSPQDLLALLTRLYLDAGLRSVEDSVQSSPITQKGSIITPHPYQTKLISLNILPQTDILKSCAACLESLESIVLPHETTAEIRVAILALVGLAVRADNTVDAKEKAFQEQLTQDLGVTEENGKRYPYLLKSATVEELCSTIKKWAIANGKPAALSATAAYLIRALGSDGVVEFREEKFKSKLLQQLNIESHQYARLLLRVHLDYS